jgi:hypothetical protein
MLFGGEVLLLDLDPGSDTVTERNLGVTAHLDDAAFAWNPAQPGVLAMIVTGKTRSDFSLDSNQPGPEGGQALALYDAAACSPPCSLRYPLPDGVPVDEIAWRPDGQRLAFVAGSLGPDASADAKSRFAEPGIYLLDPKSGATEPVAKGQNGWPNWSADGKTLVYTRGIPLPDGSPGVQVVARDMTEQGGGKEWVLVQGLPAPDTLAGRTPWEKVVAFSLVK